MAPPIGYFDGQSEYGYLKAVPNLYPAIRFRFRPIVQEQVDAHFDDLKDKPPAVQISLTNKFIANRLESWDLKGRKGEAVPISDTIVGKLQPVLRGRLFSVVIGSQPWDDDPEAPIEEREATAQDATFRAEDPAAVRPGAA